MRTNSLLGCSLLLLLAACAGGDPSTPSSNDAAPPIPAPKGDAGVAADANASDASKTDATPTCVDVPGVGTLTKVSSTDRQYMPRKLQAYNGVLYWATADEYETTSCRSTVRRTRSATRTGMLSGTISPRTDRGHGSSRRQFPTSLSTQRRRARRVHGLEHDRNRPKR